MKRWPTGNPLQLPVECITGLDRWDREDWQEARFGMPVVDAAVAALIETAPTGEDLLADAFWSFFRADPHLVDPHHIRPDHLINHVVLTEAVSLAQWHTLRQVTRGDVVAAGMAAAEVRPTLEGLLDKYDALSKLAQQLQDRLIMLSVLRDEISEAEAEGGADAERLLGELGDLADRIEAEADAAMAEFDGQAEGLGLAARSELAAAMDQAGQNLRDMAAMAATFGTEPGEWLRMDADKRLELARRLNTPRLERIARLFGPMRELAYSEMQRKVDYVHTEVVDLALGGDVTTALPSELVRLLDPARRLEFVRDLVEGKVLQYDHRGDDSVGRGGIVFCEDGSGSMRGSKEEWAKAVMLALLDIARRQRRSFTLIHFGSHYELEVISFARPADYSVEQVLYAAELYFNGGTDFERPLNEALDILDAEHVTLGRVQGDVVFCTDGQCTVSKPFMEDFKREQTRLGFHVFGINIGGLRTDEPLAAICDGRVATINDLTGGEDVRSLFRTL